MSAMPLVACVLIQQSHGLHERRSTTQNVGGSLLDGPFSANHVCVAAAAQGFANTRVFGRCVRFLMRSGNRLCWRELSCITGLLCPHTGRLPSRAPTGRFLFCWGANHQLVHRIHCRSFCREPSSRRRSPGSYASAACRRQQRAEDCLAEVQSVRRTGACVCGLCF